MDIQLAHTVSIEYILSALGAFFMFAISLGTFLWRIKTIEKGVGDLRTEITAVAAKTEAEFRMTAERTAEYREKAAAKYATRDEVADGFGKNVSQAIDNLTREITRNK